MLSINFLGSLGFDCRFDPSLSDRFHECPMIALGLVGVLHRKLANRVMKGLARTHVSGDHSGVTGPRVCSRERHSAYFRGRPQQIVVPILDNRGELHIAEVPMPALP